MIAIRRAGESEAGSTLDHPLEHLNACHRRIEERLATLERVIPYLKDRRDDALAAIRNAFAFLESNGVIHTVDEEESVFPRLYSKIAPQDSDFLHHLESDHREAESLFEELQSIATALGHDPAGDELVDRYALTAQRLCAIYRRHIAEEDSRLYAIGREVLTPAELADISREMKLRRGLPVSSQPVPGTPTSPA